VASQVLESENTKFCHGILRKDGHMATDRSMKSKFLLVHNTSSSSSSPSSLLRLLAIL
jgi:hypothetical protein